jgi:hypothetical protein
MTIQLTVKQAIQAEFDAYMKTVELSKLAVKLDAFKTRFSYGQDELEVTPILVEGKVSVTIAMGYWGCASGYHPYGSPETYSLEKGIEVLVAMKKQLADTVNDSRYSGYQMGLVLDEIKESLSI